MISGLTLTRNMRFGIGVERFQVTEEQLKEAVEEVGMIVGDVRKWLEKP